jgi:hypothetical protein
MRLEYYHSFLLLSYRNYFKKSETPVVLETSISWDISRNLLFLEFFTYWKRLHALFQPIGKNDSEFSEENQDMFWELQPTIQFNYYKLHVLLTALK